MGERRCSSSGDVVPGPLSERHAERGAGAAPGRRGAGAPGRRALQRGAGPGRGRGRGRDAEDDALVELVEAGPQLGVEAGAQLVRVADRPEAVLLGRPVGAEVLGEDEGRAEGLDQGAGVRQVHVVQGGGDEEDVDGPQVLEVVLEEEGVPRLEHGAAPEGEDVAAVLEVGAAVDGEAGVAVQGALRGHGDAGDLEGLPRAGDDDARRGQAELRGAVDAVGGDDVGAVGLRGEEARRALAEVVAVLVGDEDHVQDGRQVGGGDRGGAQAGGAVEVEVEGDEALAAAQQPAQVAEPAQPDGVAHGEELLQDGVHRSTLPARFGLARCGAARCGELRRPRPRGL